MTRRKSPQTHFENNKINFLRFLLRLRSFDINKNQVFDIEETKSLRK